MGEGWGREGEGGGKEGEGGGRGVPGRSPWGREHMRIIWVMESMDTVMETQWKDDMETRLLWV